MVNDTNDESIYDQLGSLYHGSIADFCKENGYSRHTVKNVLRDGNASRNKEEIQKKAMDYIVQVQTRTIHNKIEETRTELKRLLSEAAQMVA